MTPGLGRIPWGDRNTPDMGFFSPKRKAPETPAPAAAKPEPAHAKTAPAVAEAPSVPETAPKSHAEELRLAVGKMAAAIAPDKLSSARRQVFGLAQDFEDQSAEHKAAMRALAENIREEAGKLMGSPALPDNSRDVPGPDGRLPIASEQSKAAAERCRLRIASLVTGGELRAQLGMGDYPDAKPEPIGELEKRAAEIGLWERVEIAKSCVNTALAKGIIGGRSLREQLLDGKNREAYFPGVPDSIFAPLRQEHAHAAEAGHVGNPETILGK